MGLRILGLGGLKMKSLHKARSLHTQNGDEEIIIHNLGDKAKKLVIHGAYWRKKVSNKESKPKPTPRMSAVSKFTLSL